MSRFEGPAKDYEVLQTVRRVIALEDDDDWEQWDVGSEVTIESEDWEAVEDDRYRQASYATVLQQTVR